MDGLALKIYVYSSLVVALSLGSATAAPPDNHTQTPEQRASICRIGLEEKPDDLELNRCYRTAMARASNRDSLSKFLSSMRLKQPQSGLRWFHEGIIKLASAPKETEHFFQTCRDHSQDKGWCYFGEALAVEQQGRLSDALNLIQLARVGRYRNTIMAVAEARVQLHLGNLDRAEAMANRLAETNPNDFHVVLIQAQIHINLDEISKARLWLNRAHRLAPDSIVPHRIRADLYSKIKDPKEAARALQTALSWQPDNARIRWFLSKKLMELSQYTPAIAHLSILVDDFPGHSDYQLALGEAHLAAGSPERALGWADAALASESKDTTALELRTRALIALGHLDDALALRPLLYFDPSDALARRLRIAQAFAKKGRRGRAEAEFSAAITQHPRASAAWTTYANWFSGQNRLGRSEAILRRGLSFLPKNAELHAAIARTFEMQGLKPLARKALKTAAHLAPARREFVDELARLEFVSGQYTSAITRWEGLVERESAYDGALRNLSAAYRALGINEKAVTLIERLIRRHPEDGELHYVLGELYLKLKRKTASVLVLRKALQLSSVDKRVHSLLATALADSGDRIGAETQFQIALDADPSNRPLRLTYAHFREKNGDRRGAARLYRRQLARTANDSTAMAGLIRTVGKKRAASQIPNIRLQVVKHDVELASLAARIPDMSGARGGTVLRDERHVTASSRGIERIVHTRSVLIHSTEGVKRYGQISIGFHAQAQPKVVRARTLTPEGREITIPEKNVRYENPHEGTTLFGDARQLIMNFKGVEPGSIIDYEVITYRPHPDLGSAWWDSYILGNGDPTVRVRYTLDQPRGSKVHIFASGLAPPQIVTLDTRKQSVWERYDLPGYRVTDAAAADVPGVFVSSLSDWSAVDTWYHGLFAPNSRVTSPISIKAKQIGAQLTDRVDRISAVYRFVEQNIKYLGIEFGIGAYRPRPAESTLAQGQGDCKDMTALMVALLRALNIDAYPALVRPSDQGIFVVEHPAPGQFSHVLLYVPHAHGDYWIDATAGLGTLNTIPEVLRGQLALIVDGQGGRLLRIPVAPAQENRFLETQTYQLTETGGGKLTSNISLTGYLAGQVRQRLLSFDSTARTAILSSPGYILGRTFIPDTVHLQDLDTPSEPVRITSSLKDKDLVSVRLDGSLMVTPNLDALGTGLLSAAGGGLAIDSSRVVIREMTIILPDSYTFDWSPLNIQMEGAVSLRVSERRASGQTTITTRLEFPSRPKTPAEMTALNTAFKSIRERLSKQLIMLPGEGFDRIHFLNAITKERPNDSQLLIHLARASVLANRYAEALSALEKADRLTPDSPVVWAMMAAVYVQTNQYKKAEKRLRQVLESGHGVARLYMALSLLLREQGRYTEATRILQDGHNKFPKETEVHRELVRSLAVIGEKERAFTLGKDLARRFPNDLEIQKFFAKIAMSSGHDAEAERAFRQILAQRPDDASVLNDLAWVMRLDQSRSSEAIEFARLAVALTPTDPNAWDTLAEVYRRASKLTDALDAVERAIGLSEKPTDELVERHQTILKQLKASPTSSE